MDTGGGLPNSPLTLASIPKRRRRSIDFTKCIICGEDGGNDGFSIATPKGIGSLFHAAQIRRDYIHRYLQTEFHDLNGLPTNSDIRYHRKRMYSYTSRRNLSYVKHDDESCGEEEPNPGSHSGSASVSNTDLSSSIGSRCSRSSVCLTDWSRCIVCQKLSHKKNRKVCNIETFERSEHLKTAAKCRSDIDMMHRIMQEDLIAKGAVYHPACLSAYLSKTNIKPLLEAVDAQTEQSYHQNAFGQLIAEINDDLIKSGKAFLLSSLLERYTGFLPSNIDTQSYRSYRLQHRLLKHYGDEIVIQSQHGQGKSNIVLSSKITLADAIRAANALKEELRVTEADQDRSISLTEEDTDDTNTVLYNAASVLRGEIFKIQMEEDYPTPKGVGTQASTDLVPPMLFNIILWLIDDQAYASVDQKYQPSKEVRRRCLSIAECIIFSGGNGLTPQHVGLAVQLHNEFGSRSLIDSLHAFGFCISYDELCRFLTSTAQQEVATIQNGVYLPSGVIPVSAGGNLVHEGDDNIDINAETIDGKDTFHSMARVVFQQQSVTQTYTVSPIKREKERSLSIRPETESLMQCRPFSKPNQRPEPPRYTNPGEILSRITGTPNPVRDLSWLLLRILPRHDLPVPDKFAFLDKQVVPFWTGFNSQLSERQETFTAVAYAPVFDAKPADMATVYTTMKNCQEMCSSLGQRVSIQTMDQQLYAVAQQVKWSRPEEFQTHTVRLG